MTVFTTTFGPGGFRATRMNGQPHRHQQNANNQPRSMLVQLLPLLVLFGFSLLSALPNLFMTPPIPDPRFAFQSTARFNTELATAGHGIKYHVNNQEFMAHPVLSAELAREGLDIKKLATMVQGDAAKTQVKRGPALSKFEHSIERAYTQDLYVQCQRGLDRRERQREAEVGLFGLGTDWEKVKRIENEVIPSCEELKRMGLYK